VSNSEGTVHCQLRLLMLVVTQHDTLIRYLLDELHLSEEDHSDALCPIQREAGVSLFGEHALIKLASTEELLLVRTSLSSDIQKVQQEVGKMQQSVSTITQVFGCLLSGPSAQCQSMSVCVHCIQSHLVPIFCPK